MGGGGGAERLMAWKYLCLQKHPEASKKTKKTAAWERGCPGL